MRGILLPLGFFLMTASAGSQEMTHSARKLHALFQQDWQHRLRDDPVFASYLGDRRYNHVWTEVSPAAWQRRDQYARRILEELAAIPFDELDEADRLNYRLFEREYREKLRSYNLGQHYLTLNQRGGIQTADELASALRFETLKDYEDWISRLQRFSTYMDETIELLREGIRLGIVQPRVVMERIPSQISAQRVERPEDSSFYRPFLNFVPEMPQEEQEELRARAGAAVRESVLPAFGRFDEFFNQEYLPASQEGVGAWRLPRGEERYDFLARFFTTTELTPAEIHDIGLSEVTRIRSEMEAVIRAVDFEGTFDEFLDLLRTDSRFYFRDPQELLTAYRALSREIDPTLVRLFGKLPRIPYGIEPIPDAIAPDTTTAYYRPPAADGSRAGTYFVNLYRPEVRPKYEMEALSIHEAVPGHHLQIALAMELEDVPEFRRHARFTAFTEGWALYAESLGEELGFYQDPYSKFGQLTYEMWRAVRLVVDTGLHSKRWTREQAIEYFRANAAKTEQDIVNEIDRYIAWPGQALAYKVGELRIKEMRALANQELGQSLDVRAFHDAVLSLGAVPLDVLEDHVRSWIEQTRSSPR